MGLTSTVILLAMQLARELSRISCDFMICSKWADQPYTGVVGTHDESINRQLPITFSALLPKTSFMSMVRGSNSALGSSTIFFPSSSSK